MLEDEPGHLRGWLGSLELLVCPTIITAKQQHKGRRKWQPLEKGVAAHSRILAWRIPQTEEPGGLYSPWGCKESDTTEQVPLHFSNTHICTFQPH